MEKPGQLKSYKTSDSSLLVAAATFREDKLNPSIEALKTAQQLINWKCLALTTETTKLVARKKQVALEWTAAQ